MRDLQIANKFIGCKDHIETKIIINNNCVESLNKNQGQVYKESKFKLGGETQI